MEIDSILEIILEFCILYYVELKTLPQEIALPSFFFILEEGVIIYMEIDSILEILKLYLEKLAFSFPLFFLSSREGYRDYLYGDRFDLGNYSRIILFYILLS